MKRTLLIFLTLIVTSLYCQETYPRKIVLDKDTVVAITQSDCKFINQMFVDVNYCKIVGDSLKSEIILLKEIVQKDSLIISEKNLNLTKSQVVIDNTNKIVKETSRELEKTRELLIEEKEQSTTRGTVLGFSLIANVVVILIYALSK